MGLRGELPEGLRLELHRGMEMPEGQTVTCVAYLGEEPVGTLAVDVDGTIAAVDVEEAWRRRGIATAMLEQLRGAGYDPQHDWVSMFDDGVKWAASILPAEDAGDRVVQRPKLDELGRTPAPIVPAASLVAEIEALRPALAEAAQREYNQWEQDEDGLDPELGAGICDRVAQALAGVIAERLDGVEFDDGGFDGDEHAWIVVSRGGESLAVDIPPGVYESGGGYRWRKLDGVQFTPEDIVVERIDGPTLEI